MTRPWEHSIKTAIVLSLIALITLLAGCSSTGKASLNQAEDALRAGDNAAALAYATDAIIEDPKFSGAKKFLRDNAELALKAAKAYLEQTKGTDVPEDLEKRYDSYVSLVRYNNNLKKIGLPITEGKKLFGLVKGWEWTTTIEEYAEDVEKSRAEARAGFLAATKKAINAGDIAAARGLASKVVNKFAVKGSDEVAQDRLDISDLFANWAKKQHGSKNIETLLTAITAYETAISYNGENKAAVDGLAKIKIELSDVYLAEGLRSEKMGTVESLTAAIDLFEKALKYNSGNSEAKDGIPRAKTKIAELYYNEALRLARDTDNNDSLKKAIAALDKANEWQVGYKDIVVLKLRYEIFIEVNNVSVKSKGIYNSFNLTKNNFARFASDITKANKGVKDLNYVSGAVIQLRDQIDTIGTTLGVMSGIPVVGTALSVVNTGLDQVMRPVGPVADLAERFKGPYIEPSAAFMSDLKANSDIVTNSLAQIGSINARTVKFVMASRPAINKIEDPAVLKALLAATKDLSTQSTKLAQNLENVDKARTKSENTLSTLADSVGVVSKVTGGVKAVMKPLNSIKGVTDKIDSALNQRIKIPLVGSFTVREALESTTGLVKKAAEAILNPILKQLNIKFPSIPGIDELKKILEPFQEYHAKLKEASANVRDAATAFQSLPGSMNTTFDKIAGNGVAF